MIKKFAIKIIRADTHIAEVKTPVRAVRGQRSDPRIPKEYLEEAQKRLVELRELDGRNLVEIRHANNCV